MKDSKTDGKKKHDFREDTPSDRDTCEKEAVEGESLVQDNSQRTPDDDASCMSISIQNKLSIDTNTTSSWTSKINEDSPRIIQPPRGEELFTREDTASSVYSCDEQVKATTKTTTISIFGEALSVISGYFTRESATPASSRLTNGNVDYSKMEREWERSENHKAALAKLEGREQDEDAASCYETMGWGGPSR
ncbi:hypothetical protein TsFJ059_003447 [Trichoderma semiorbis]|uniref:Uncharacterized protein n=1 Tax=Trichoderma semiorbis TaxID=1491008 RepID=A0A9P8KP30_9HYPO|nr:hypothetical protein TsFJ059_003447 [Trichoderma semiorbis]